MAVYLFRVRAGAPCSTGGLLLTEPKTPPFPTSKVSLRLCHSLRCRVRVSKPPQDVLQLPSQCLNFPQLNLQSPGLLRAGREGHAGQRYDFSFQQTLFILCHWTLGWFHRHVYVMARLAVYFIYILYVRISMTL